MASTYFESRSRGNDDAATIRLCEVALRSPALSHEMRQVYKGRLVEALVRAEEVKS